MMVVDVSLAGGTGSETAGGCDCVARSRAASSRSVRTCARASSRSAVIICTANFNHATSDAFVGVGVDVVGMLGVDRVSVSPATFARSAPVATGALLAARSLGDRSMIWTDAGLANSALDEAIGLVSCTSEIPSARTTRLGSTMSVSAPRDRRSGAGESDEGESGVGESSSDSVVMGSYRPLMFAHEATGELFMDFELAEDQRVFRDTVRSFVDREIRPVAREIEQAGTYPGDIIEKMKDMGLFGLTIAEAHGGLGVDCVTLAVVFEEISRGWMGVAGAIGSHGLACRMIQNHGTDDQRQRFLADLASGRRRSGIALTEPDAGSDLQGIKCVARRDGDSYVVNGTKTWITNARYADPLPVLVKTDPTADPRHRGMSVLLVEKNSPGCTVTRDLGKLGYRGVDSSEVVFEDCRVPIGNLLGGEEGHGMQQALSGLEVGRINIAARAVGVAHRALEEAHNYSQERHAFGQPIGHFQAVQMKIADMATEVQAARLLTWWAASRLDAGGRADVETGMCKLFASEVALKASLESMRIHGGYGYSTDFEVERLYRDAPLMAIGEGTNDILRTLIARGIERSGLPAG